MTSATATARKPSSAGRWARPTTSANRLRVSRTSRPPAGDGCDGGAPRSALTPDGSARIEQLVVDAERFRRGRLDGKLLRPTEPRRADRSAPRRNGEQRRE